MRQIVALRGRSARGSIDERRRFRGDRPANPAIVSEPITAKLGAERPAWRYGLGQRVRGGWIEQGQSQQSAICRTARSAALRRNG